MHGESGSCRVVSCACSGYGRRDQTETVKTYPLTSVFPILMTGFAVLAVPFCMYMGVVSLLNGGWLGSLVTFGLAGFFGILTGGSWFTVLSYEEVYLKGYENGREAKAGIDASFRFYNTQRPHQALGYRTPAEVLNGNGMLSTEATTGRKWSPSKSLVSYTGGRGPSLNLAPILSN